jgi:membrane protease YdiL (CAAX protease family)
VYDVAMNPKAAAAFCIGLAALAAGTAVLSEINSERGSEPLLWVMVSRFGMAAIFAVFGIYAARESGMRGSIILTADEPRAAFQDLLNYGILPGFIIGLINYLFFFINRYNPRIAPRIRGMEDVYDSFLVSFNASVFEEVVYRLFILSCLMFLIQHLYQGIKSVWPVMASLIPRAMALVLSSLLFAVAHNVYGFTGAFCGGLMLGFIFMRSGIESAIAAHFVANFLFFSVSYLS